VIDREEVHPLLNPRFAKHIVVVDSGCWIWGGHLNRNGGYGRLMINGIHRSAHRAVYESVHGPIAAGLTLDHLCRVKRCVNPAHLEPVTNKENILRGISFSAVNAAKTERVNGHSLSDAFKLARGDRRCRVCSATAKRKWRRRESARCFQQSSAKEMR